MPYYRECPDCGAHLDPGESCDCKERDAGAAEPKDGARVTMLASYQQMRNRTFHHQKPQLIHQKASY